ncbi:hypothetical protein DUZ99_19530 [Xylanibacillus composti]|uniref:Tetratricopeptide repeat protein n=1 Tax=Xylanibacillus composti TaxID=1572762 RepID=A0A8J4M3B8_9BACL|nr:hypothetical protein [Xylanibacillus composti]MDT9727157.1 hypothetical protein [Xylanibacillus composti]GIQ70654.1 hypothetical protein XYCOK13_34780 [Xylanibacillus composti]
MKLFNFFKRSNKRSEESSHNNTSSNLLFSHDLEEAQKRLNETDYQGAILYAERHMNSENREVMIEAHKLTALANFRLGNYNKAAKLYEAVTRNNGHDVHTWFNLMTSSILSRNIELGVKAFKVAVDLREKSTNSNDISIPHIKYYYCRAMAEINEYELAIKELNDLMEYYKQLKVTDVMFLYMRGVPSLAQTMEAAIIILNGLGNSVDHEIWIENIQSELDEEGKKYLEEIKKEFSSVLN